MANYPQPIKQREELNLRLGIKSSLSQLRSVVASLYVMYCANDKQSSVVFSKEINTSGLVSIKLDDNLSLKIVSSYGQDFAQLVEKSPLFSSQLEALQVGIELFFHLGKIDFVKAGLSERTGSNRYQKQIAFSTNMILVDLYLASHSIDDVKKLLSAWLLDEPFSSKLEEGLRLMLNTFTEETLYKVRDDQAHEIIFNQECVYSEILTSKEVASNDVKEPVGPFRIYKSFLSSGLHPFIVEDKQIIQLHSNVNEDDMRSYSEMVNTTLSLIPQRYTTILDTTESTLPLGNAHQVIYYGAPGTGKSQAVLRRTKGCNTIRTTFHPDSDYSTFVGCYKPTTDPVYDKNGHPTTEEKITYSYSEQAFLQAYLNAWKAMDTPEPKPQFLIIEEINRGNCAQIFGDLFQLLDRKYGYSEYPIDADSDLRKQLAKKFQAITIAKELEDEINKIFIEHYPDGIVKKIKDGELLLLPKNLYIWATMNTSDQSLFPIDSAFKRRWQWRYVKISKGIDETTKQPLNWTIDFDYKDKEGAKHYTCDWWEFIKAINEKIAVADSSDDKKLGYFFCKPMSGTSIDAETFVSKVIFYLWTDVFKDNDNEIFRIDGEPSFDIFYKEDENGYTVVETNILYQFMQKVFDGKAESATDEQEHTSEEE